MDGVTLEPGERVLVWMQETGHTGRVVSMVLVGLFLLPVLLGVLILYNAITYKKRTNYTEILTDRRFALVKGDGTIVSIPFDTITRVTTVKRGNVESSLMLESSAAPRSTVSMTALYDQPAGSIKLVDFLNRRREPGFLETVVATGRAKGLGAAS